MHSRPNSVLRTCSRRLRKSKRIRIARFGFGLLQVNRLSYYFCRCFDQISVNCFQVILVRQKIKLDIREISEISFPRNSHWTSCAVFMPWDSFPRLSVIDLLFFILQAARTRQHPRRTSRRSRLTRSSFEGSSSSRRTGSFWTAIISSRASTGTERHSHRSRQRPCFTTSRTGQVWNVDFEPYFFWVDFKKTETSFISCRRKPFSEHFLPLNLRFSLPQLT